MFVSFFPKPKLFFISAAIWSLLAIFAWYGGVQELGATFGLPPLKPGEQAPIGVSVFWSAPFIWFYIYYFIVNAIFGIFWQIFSPHPWQRWSIWGSALIIFTTYFGVQVTRAINAWYGPFYDMIQSALSKPGS